LANIFGAVVETVDQKKNFEGTSGRGRPTKKKISRVLEERFEGNDV